MHKRNPTKIREVYNCVSPDGDPQSSDFPSHRFFITRVSVKITNAYVAFDVIALQQCCAVFFYFLVNSYGLKHAVIKNRWSFKV